MIRRRAWSTALILTGAVIFLTARGEPAPRARPSRPRLRAPGTTDSADGHGFHRFGLPSESVGVRGFSISESFPPESLPPALLAMDRSVPADVRAKWVATACSDPHDSPMAWLEAMAGTEQDPTVLMAIKVQLLKE